jgi:hypothetical protein
MIQGLALQLGQIAEKGLVSGEAPAAAPTAETDAQDEKAAEEAETDDGAEEAAPEAEASDDTSEQDSNEEEG